MYLTHEKNAKAINKLTNEVIKLLVRPDLSHLVLVGLFMSRDLPLQVLDVALQRADQPQQPLPLLFQLVYVCASLINLPLQTVEL